MEHRKRFILITAISVIIILLCAVIYYYQYTIKEVKRTSTPVIDPLNAGLSVTDIRFIEKVQKSYLSTFIIENESTLENLRSGINKSFSTYLDRINDYYDEMSKIEIEDLEETDLEAISLEVFHNTIMTPEELDSLMISLIEKYNNEFYDSLDAYYKSIKDYSQQTNKLETIDTYSLSRDMEIPQYNSKYVFASLDAYSEYYETLVFRVNEKKADTFIVETNKDFVSLLLKWKTKSETIAYAREVLRKEQATLINSLTNEMKYYHASIEHQSIRNLKAVLREN